MFHGSIKVNKASWGLNNIWCICSLVGDDFSKTFKRGIEVKASWSKKVSEKGENGGATLLRSLVKRGSRRTEAHSCRGKWSKEMFGVFFLIKKFPPFEMEGTQHF